MKKWVSWFGWGRWRARSNQVHQPPAVDPAKTEWTDGEKEFIKLDAQGHSRVATGAWNAMLFTVPAGIVVLPAIPDKWVLVTILVGWIIVLKFAFDIARDHEAKAKARIMDLDRFRKGEPQRSALTSSADVPLASADGRPEYELAGVYNEARRRAELGEAATEIDMSGKAER